MNTFAPVSLQCGIPFSKNISLASALQYPFRTGSKHPKKCVASHTGLGTNAGNVTKKFFRRVLNRGRRTESRLLFGSFCRSKKNKLVPFREISRFCKPRISAPQRRFRTGRFAAFAGASRRRPLPVHTKRVCRLPCKHSQAAKPPFGRSLSGTFHLL